MPSKLSLVGWGTGAGVTLALIGAGAAAGLHHGFGIHDLEAFALLSVPLGLTVGLLVIPFVRATGRWPAALTYGVGFLIGISLGLAWTAAVAGLVGPAFAAMSIPVAPSWAVGGGGGLVVGSAHARQRGPRVLLLYAIILGCMAMTAAAGWAPFTAWLSRDQMLTVVFLKWTPSQGTLEVGDGHPSLQLSPEETAAIPSVDTQNRPLMDT